MQVDLAISEDDNAPQRKQRARRKPRQDRAVIRRRKILEGAKRLLSEDGSAKFRMRRLADISGVGLGTIYDYFPSREHIIRELLDERFDLRCAILDETLADVSRDKGLKTFVPAYLSRLAQLGFWHDFDQQLRDAVDADPELRAQFERQEDAIAARYVEEMRRARSPLDESAMLQIARTNMAVSQMLLSKLDEPEDARALSLKLAANMILANLKLSLWRE